MRDKIIQWIIILFAPVVLQAHAGDCVPPPSGLVGWWPGDGNANDAVGTNHGTLANGASYAPGKSGAAFSFDGIDDFVEIPHSQVLSFEPGATATIEFWFYRTKGAPTQHLLGKRASCDSFGGYNYQSALDGNSSSITLNVWIHFAQVYAADGMTVYTNGILFQSFPGFSFAPQNTATLRLGTSDGCPLNQTFGGLLDEVCIYNRALSANEIAAIFAAGSAGMCKSACFPHQSGLVAWYPLEGNANDASGHGHNGFLSNAVTFVTGMSGQAARLDGSNAYIRVAEQLTKSNSFTWVLWFRPSLSSTSAWADLIDQGGFPGSGQISPAFEINAPSRPGSLRFFTFDGGAQNLYSQAKSSWSTQRWHHVAITSDSTTGDRCLYLDGTCVDFSKVAAFGQPLTNFYIGGAPNGHFFDGTIDEVMIYDRALSNNEIAAIYAAGSAGMCKPEPVCTPLPAGIVSWWPGETNVNDLVGGNHGSLTSDATLVAGLVGQAFFFDGQDDYARIPTSSSLRISGDFTVEFWFRPTVAITPSDPAAHTIFSKGVTESIGTANNGGKIEVRGLNPRLVSTTSNWDSNTWYHAAVTYTVGTYHLFINGLEESATNSTHSILDNTADVQLGSLPQSLSPFGGLVDEIAIFRRALSAVEVQAIYRSGSSGKCKQDVLFIDFNAGVDSLGNSAGELIFNGPNGFQVRLSDDESNGPQGGNANGVHISNIPYANIRLGTTNLVLGAQNDYLGGGTVNRHSSGIVANFNIGVERVGLFDTDDDTTIKALFAFDQSGTLIGQTPAGSQGSFSIDKTMTGGRRIFAVEFDTAPGTSGGSFDGTYFTIDDFHVDYFANCPGGCAQSDLALTMTVAPTFLPAGSNVTFTILVTNRGPDAATGVVVTNGLLPGMAFVSAAFTHGNCINSSGNVICTGSVLTNRGVAVISIVATPTVAGNVTNMASVTAIEVDSNPTNNVALVQTTVTPPHQSVLFVNVNGDYNGDGNNFYQTLLMAGARATFINLSANGQVAALIQANHYDQIWVYDLSSGSDNYPADWQAIGDWHNARTNLAIICDGRIISSYWSGRWLDQGRRLTQNYYENLKRDGGGLMLGTDHNAYQGGINSINDRIGLQRFTGNFNLNLIPVDICHRSMIYPNDLGNQLYDDSSPGQTPFGLQPNGRILYSVAWHSGNTNTPGISSTIPGCVGFDIQITSPVNNSQFNEEALVSFQVDQHQGTPPFAYSWTSDRDGLIAAGSSFQIMTLSPGTHQITVVGTDGAGAADSASVRVTVLPVAPAVAVDLRAGSDSGASNTDNVTSDTIPIFDVTVNKRGRIELDYTGDGVAEEVRTNLSSDTFVFTTQPLTDGAHAVTARFVPLSGNPVNASLNITIDTHGPRVLGMTPPSGATLSQAVDHLDVTFDTPLDGATFNPADVSILGPASPTATGVAPVGGNAWRVNLGMPFPDGTHSIVIGPNVTDLAGNLMNQDSDATNGESPDDAFIAQITASLPDLAATEISASANALMGSPLTVTWAITNMGSTTAIAPWRDAILLADNPAGTNAQPLSSFIQSNSLLPASSLTRTATVILPPGAFGDRYLVVHTDSDGQSFEGTGETNNIAVSTNKLRIQAADLVVELVEVTPSSAQFGESVQVKWTVRNAGDGPATTAWRDRLYLSTTSSPVGATPLATVDSSTAPSLSAGASYTRTQQVAVALNSQLPSKDYFIVAAVDFDSNQPEASETNNAANHPLHLQLPPLPDLAVSSLIVPTNGQAGQPVVLIWTVTNQGPAAATKVWSEVVSVSNIVSGVQTLDVFTYTNGLDRESSVTRTQTVTFPVTGPAGDVWLIVETDNRREVFEANELNNVTVATNPTVLPLELRLQVPVTQISEDSVNPVIRATVTRNGAVAQPLTVTLTNGDPTELTVPPDVVIAAGSSAALFDIRVLRDGVVDGPQAVTVAALADEYQSDAVQITVLNADLPRLMLTLTTNVIAEGNAILAIITRDMVTSNSLPVFVRSSAPGQLTVPDSVVIPGYSNAITFVVLGVDDNLLEPPTDYALTASTPGFESSAASVTILDNDVPQVTVSVANHMVSEGAGPQATFATITRNVVSARQVLLDVVSSDQSAALVPTRVAIPANQASVSFPVAAVDDGAVDGPQSTIISAYVLVTGSNTRIAESSPDVLTVTDDDGAALRLTIAQRVVREGVAPATVATVSRNTPATNELNVTLVSSDIREATVPVGVTIPMGANSASFEIASVADATNDGSQTVIITASAPGYAAASDILLVSDTDLPDLIVSSFTVPTSAETEGNATVTYRVVNQGLAGTTRSFLTKTFLSRDLVLGDDTFLSEYRFEATLPVGQYFEHSLNVRFPLTTGNYWIIVTTDAEQSVSEGLENNNTAISSTPVAVAASYSAAVSTEVEVALAGSPIPMHGHATNSFGTPVVSKQVNIHILVRGTERIISAFTGADGSFATTWQPLPGEAGAYEIFATHPGVAQAPVQDIFRLLGMKANPPSLVLRVVEESSVQGTISLENLSDQPLTNLTVEVLSKPADLGVTTNLSSTTLPGLGTVALTCGFTADSAAAYGLVHLRISSGEGAIVEVYFSVSVEPLRPRLVAIPSELSRGMARGRQVMVEFDVANLGAIPTGPITVSLPGVPWLQLASTNPLVSLEPGETNRVTLLLTPAIDMPLGPYTGNLALNAAQAGLSVPFNFRALSEAKGDVLVTAVDEFTFYADGAPKVAGATVTIRDAVTGQIVTNGITGTNGSFFAATLMEGFYDVEVSASQHNSRRVTRLLEAGITNEVEAFLSRQTVQYVWRVEPTQVEDRTRIVLETVFETFVPAPVVTVEPALIDLAEVHGDVTVIELKISNHGLIAAKDVRLNIPNHARWEFIPLLTDIGTLPGNSSVSVPVTIRRLNANGSGGAGRMASQGASSQSGPDPCNFGGAVCYHFDCGKYSLSVCLPVGLINALLNCNPPNITVVPPEIFIPPPPPPAPPPPPGPPPPNPPPTQVVICCNPPPQIVETPVSCEECVDNLIKAAVGCVLEVIPFVFDFDDVQSCIYSGVLCGADPDLLGCIGAGFDCAAAVGKEVPFVGTMISIISCLNGLFGACTEGNGNNFTEAMGTELPFQASHDQSSKVGLLRLGQKSLASASFGGQFPQTILQRYPALALLAERGDRLQAHANFAFSLIGDEAWFHSGQGTNFGAWLSIFSSKTATNSQEGQRISQGERTELLSVAFPDGVSSPQIHKFLDRWNRTLNYYAAGIYVAIDVPSGQSMDFIARDVFTNALASRNAAIVADKNEGIPNPVAGVRQAYDQFVAQVTSPTNAGAGVCAQVRLRLEQEAVITRDAFKATLDIINSSPSSLQNVSVLVVARNAAGQESTHLFGIRPPVLANIGAVDGSGIVTAGTTASASWIILPASDAAPEVTTQYFISGTLSYAQDGLTVTVPFAPVPITVHPNPRLFVNYFHQRDVFSDDPFTDVIEPSIPFSLAVMVENKGKGLARNVRLSSAQPEIVENEKGLLVDFHIIAAEVAGQNVAPSLTVNFGSIDPSGIGIGRWLLTSTLQGLFIDYHATFEHIDGLGNPKLSLIEDVAIHEMIHLVQATGSLEDGRPDFLVNDEADTRDLPDTLYLSDGSTNAVQVVEQASAVTLSPTNVQLTAPMPGGWGYLRVPEPLDGQLRIVRVRRSDGTNIAFGTNVWVTDRTFIGLGRQPVRENMLHLLDYDSTGTYTLEYVAPPPMDTNAPDSAVTALPADSYEQIPLNWSGMDETNGSGLAFFDIYVSANSGPFQLWMQRTALRGAIYSGAVGSHYAFYSVATDNAGNREQPASAPDTQTSVNLTNRPPLLALPGVITVNEGQTVTVTNFTSDPDIPVNILTFSMESGAPPGAVIDPNTGVVTWSTGEGNGPSTNVITLRVKDNGVPSLATTAAVTVIVNEINTAPVLFAITPYTIREGQTLVITNRASDVDLPAQRLTFSLGPDAPEGAAIHPNTGIFTWRPAEFQGGTTNRLYANVADDGQGGLTATQSFTVVVLDTRSDFAVSAGSTNVFVGESNSVTLRLASGADLKQVTFIIDVPYEQLTNLTLQSLAAEVESAVLDRSNATVSAMSSDVLRDVPRLAQLGFTAVSNEHSIIVPIRITDVAGTRPNGARLGNGRGAAGRVFVIGREPILDPLLSEDQQRLLILYGHPNRRYAVDFTTNLLETPVWNLDRTVDLETAFDVFEPLPKLVPAVFYRARELGDLTAALSIRQEDSNVLIEWASDCAGCLLEETIALGPQATWTRTNIQPQVIGSRYRVTLPNANGNRFYRLRAR